ncbi:MAG: glycosyltransferase family 2 protein [Hyphomonadaceae bacterium]|nr:glycosyltransferase family 2 protein [Hyphomonadaceae bacterium]
MTARRRIEEEARVLALRLRLGLVDLAAVERWADQAILEDDGSLVELPELCLARQAGERTTQVRLATLAGDPAAIDVMRSLGAVKVEAQTPDELRKLADNLDPILKEIDRAKGLPDILKPALKFSGDFWSARVHGMTTMESIETEMRELLHAVKEYAAELPESEAEKKVVADNRSVSAIVVSYRTGDVLFDCLAALVADPQVDEIILVDNGNPKEMVWRIDERFGHSGKVKVTGGGENRGFAAGINLGVTKAKGDRLLVINPDAILQPGSVAALEAARGGQVEPIVVGGKIHGADGVEQRGARRRRLSLRSAAVTFLGMGWLKAFNPGFVSINRNTEPEPAGPVAMDAVSGALMYLSRSGFDRLWGFDEGYFLHVEDLDLCRRAEADGGSVIYTSLARALHHGATSDVPTIEVERHKAAGLGRYFRKFAETPAEKTAAALLGPAITLALLARAWVRRH